MASKHIVTWPKVRVFVDGESVVLGKGTLVPKGVSLVELDNLTSFGAIAGVVDTLPEPGPPIEPTSNEPGDLLPIGPDGVPAKSASKAVWVAYATDEARGDDRLSDGDAGALTRDQLADKYHG